VTLTLTPDGSREAVWVGEPTPEDVTRVRCQVRAVLVGWQVRDDVAEDALLVVGELSANAVVHARTPFRLVVRLKPPLLRVTVEDGHVGAVPLRTNPTQNQICGLRLVNALALRWGWAEHATGKTVWAEFMA
jgi:anti-sigma regulatory factor (Ser/Thr protein kinase)